MDTTLSSSEHDDLKQAAAAKAIEYVADGMVVGLGTGTTARHVVEDLGARVAAGLRIVGIPTSERTTALARDLGIPLSTLEDHPQIDVTIDGADEIDLSTFYAVKGLGGALLREKIVALATALEIIVVDATKIVTKLGTHAPVPVEVATFGWSRTRQSLASLGCDPILRTTPDGSPYITDSGNYLLDCRFPPIDDPSTLAAQIKAITGVVDHGLFLNVVGSVIIASPQGVQVIDKPTGS
ncbi:MAG: ribose-5-phosphate isomerase RpiA [Chloroflexia bacterium]